jgi:hypothetical protein
MHRLLLDNRRNHWLLMLRLYLHDRLGMRLGHGYNFKHASISFRPVGKVKSVNV